MTIRRGIAAVVASQLLWLSSCSEDDPEPVIPEPSVSTSSTATTTATPTPTVDPLAIPAAARKPTKAGAEALVRHYYDMFNHLWATGDSLPVRKLYGERCSLCEAPIGAIELAQSKGHSYEGSAEVISIQVELLGKVVGILGGVVFVDIRQTEVVERDANSEVVNRFPAVDRESFEYFVAFQDGKWEITNAEVSK